jgi:hypothetical protein
MYKVLIAEPKWGVMPLYVGTFGTLAVIAGVAAIIAARRRREPPLRGSPPSARLLALLAASGVLLALLLATKPIGPFVVRHVPLAEYVQFPWRMFLFAASLAPLCAPAALDGFVRTPRRRWLVSAALTLLVMAVMTPRIGPPAPLVRDRLDVQRFLRSLDIDYVTSMNEYLPKTVRRTVPRFGEVVHVLDGGARVLKEERTPGRYDVTVEAPAPSLLELNAHWFPGWRAYLDGAPHAIGPGIDQFDDGGLIRVRVPAGRHQVQLVYGRTPLRLASDLVSLVALAALLALFGLAARAVLRSRRAAQG